MNRKNIFICVGTCFSSRFYSPIVVFEFLFFVTLRGGFESFCIEGKFLDFLFSALKESFWFPSLGSEGKFWFPWG